jgi:spore germination cell wall hydrolase CwlJ-like protein|tara:strand:- start:42 stop:587 length:546 start_codon:yes stop_codon:yes gene_type:complete
VLKELLTTFVVSASAAGVEVTPHDATEYLDKQATCLAKNMYYEARSQGLAGQLAVSLVVLNRVKDNRYPNTICEVVHQGPVRESWKTRGKNVPESARKYYPIRHQCQFSWYCDGKSDEPKEPTTYGALYDMALDLVYGDITVVDITEGATHYHADYVYPSWRKTKTRTIEIEDHIFYRWEK